MYGAVKVLYSYDEVMEALDIVRERQEVKPTYTVNDMGDTYTVLYYFIREGVWTEYPMDYETYFANISNGFFCTYIFLNEQACPGHGDNTNCLSAKLRVNKFDEDYKKIVKYKSQACIRIYYEPTTASHVIAEIEDASLLRYTESGNRYFIYYSDKEIMQLWSCIKLDDAFFDIFFDSVVTTSVKG